MKGKHALESPRSPEIRRRWSITKQKERKKLREKQKRFPSFGSPALLTMYAETGASFLLK